MPVMIYSQYTKPEGTLKFDDLVLCAKRNNISALALTDHGNFSGIMEFYSKCLDNAIKPVVGIDLFCRLNNGRYTRLNILIKNYNGYKNMLSVVSRIKKDGRCSYFDIDDVVELNNCYLCVNMYSTDILSEEMAIEKDLNYLFSQFKATGINLGSVFLNYVICEDKYNIQILKDVIRFSKETGIKTIACNPVYYLEKGMHGVKKFACHISGSGIADVESKSQYVLFFKENIDKYPDDALNNTGTVINSCNFLIEDIPERFPRMKFRYHSDQPGFYDLKEKVRAFSSVLKEELRQTVIEELAFIRKNNISDIILFLIDAKNHYYEIYGKKIFFSGFMSDLFIPYLFDLTLSSPVFASFTYHRSVLANKKITPVVSVIVSPDERQNLYDFLSQKFSVKSICFLSEYVKWQFNTLLALAEKEFGLDSKLSEELRSAHSKIPRNMAFTFTGSKDINDLLSGYPDCRDVVEKCILMSDSFKNYNTNTGELVICDEKISEVLPVQYGSKDTTIGISFYNTHTAKHFGVWNINIESMSYLDIRDHFEMGPVDIDQLKELFNKLTECIKADDLSLIPYFSHNNERMKYLETGSSYIWNLILYLDSYHTNLSFIFNRPPPEHPRLKFKKELDATRGFIIYKEQLYFICDRLFKAKEATYLKRKLCEASGIIQFNTMLKQIAEEDRNKTESCDFLQKAVHPGIFHLSFSDTLTRVIIALRMLDLRTYKKYDLYEYVFCREVNSNTDWRKYISEMVSLGYKFKRISFTDPVRKIKITDRTVTLPPYCIKGISPNMSEYICRFCENSFIDSFSFFLEKTDRSLIKHKIIDLLIKTGFFGDLNPNMKQLEKINDLFFKNLKTDDKEQPVLFENSQIDMSTQTPEKDYTEEEKAGFIEDLIGRGISFACDNKQYESAENIQNLMISLHSDEAEKLEWLSEELSEQGKCNVEVYFHDTKKTLQMKRPVIANGLFIYKLRKRFSASQYYFEMISE